MFYIDLVGIHLTLWAQCVSYETSFLTNMKGWFNVGLVQEHILCFMFYMSRMICMQCNPFTIILTLKIWSVQNRIYVLCFIYHIGISLTFLAHCVSYETSFMFISCWIEVILVTQHVLCFTWPEHLLYFFNGYHMCV